jgi:hypothetical protein
MSTTSTLPTEQLLTEFDAAANTFFDAFDRVPDSALRFRPDSDDYAVSGILFHVAGALEYYGTTLASAVAAGFGPIDAIGPPNPIDVTLAHDGIGPDDRDAALERVHTAHDRLRTLVGNLARGDVDRKTPIRFADSSDPLPTSAHDIVDWMREHYQEHVPHLAELLTRWRARRAF